MLFDGLILFKQSPEKKAGLLHVQLRLGKTIHDKTVVLFGGSLGVQVSSSDVIVSHFGLALPWVGRSLSQKMI